MIRFPPIKTGLAEKYNQVFRRMQEIQSLDIFNIVRDRPVKEPEKKLRKKKMIAEKEIR